MKKSEAFSQLQELGKMDGIYVVGKIRANETPDRPTTLHPPARTLLSHLNEGKMIGAQVPPKTVVAIMTTAAKHLQPPPLTH